MTVPLCGKLALHVCTFHFQKNFTNGKQRKLFLKESGSKYWDGVDRYLEVIRQRADGDAVKIATYVTLSFVLYLLLIIASSIFKNLIKKDIDAFGSKDSDRIPDDLNHFQQNIEDSLDRLL